MTEFRAEPEPEQSFVRTLSTRMPDLAALQLLLVVHRLGSLSAAAADVGISQAAASSRISYMERLVGLPLLVRGAQGSYLTREGRQLVTRAQDLLRHAGIVDSELAALRRERETSLTIAASNTVADHLLPAWLATARARSSMTLSAQTLTSGHVMTAVLDGQADLGFIAAPALRHGLSVRVVTSDRLVVVVTPCHPWAARRTTVTGQELAQTQLVHREVGSGTRETWEAALAHLGPLARPAWQSTSTRDLLQAALRGVAPAVVSDLAAAPHLAHGRLVAVSTSGVRLDRELRAVWPLGQPLRPAQRNFLAIADDSSGIHTTG